MKAANKLLLVDEEQTSEERYHFRSTQLENGALHPNSHACENLLLSYMSL